MIRPCLERNFFLPTQGRNPERAARASQSVSFVAPPRAHYTTVSTDLSPRSTHVRTEYSLTRAAIMAAMRAAQFRYEVGLSQHSG